MMTPGGPGWNDPPSLSYETHTQTTSRRNLLTKRVGLPNLTVPNEPMVSSPIDKNMLPPSGKKDLHPPPKMKTQVAEQTRYMAPPSDQSKAIENDNNDNKNITTAGTSENLSHTRKEVTIFNPSLGEDSDDKTTQSKKANDKINECDIESITVDIVAELKNLAEHCHDKKTFNAQVKNTILKKIAILEKQIDENKLSDPVLKKVETLTKFLVVKKYDCAWDTHLALVCDHSSSVMQWMVGVKKLISEAKKLN